MIHAFWVFAILVLVQNYKIYQQKTIFWWMKFYLSQNPSIHDSKKLHYQQSHLTEVEISCPVKSILCWTHSERTSRNVIMYEWIQIIICLLCSLFRHIEKEHHKGINLSRNLKWYRESYVFVPIISRVHITIQETLPLWTVLGLYFRMVQRWSDFHFVFG